jgi:hypothetical protein
LLKVFESRPTMQTPPLYTTLPVEGEQTDRSRQPAGLAYPAVTLIAILLLLGSLWAF